jgi:hypothetical protein
MFANLAQLETFHSLVCESALRPPVSQQMHSHESMLVRRSK